MTMTRTEAVRRVWTCPFCGSEVEEGGARCGACPFDQICSTLCCQHCSYRFAERSATLDWLGRLWRDARRRARSGSSQPC